MKEFKKEVCEWLRKHSVPVENLIMKSHIAMDGYVICWNEAIKEHVVFNRYSWDKYIGYCFESIRKTNLRTL